MRLIRILAALAALCLGPGVAAQELIGSYTARIGTDDLYNSKGQPLSAPWQVLRQDRANYHRFGISHPGDEWDPFFDSIENRAAMERLIRRGGLPPEVRRRIMQGGAQVRVSIFGSGGRGDWVEVTLVGAAGVPQLVASYTAFIGADDLYNSEGQPLGAPWQVLRQDRANYHRFGISQPGDEWDPVFDSMENRAAMERMLRRGYIAPGARSRLMQGGARVMVRIYGTGGRGEYIDVTVH